VPLLRRVARRTAVVGYAEFGAGLSLLIVGAGILGARTREVVTFLTISAVAYLLPVVAGSASWERLA
jgi:hypothetical protein